MGSLKIIASKRNFIDSNTVDSLKRIKDFKSVVSVVALPDLSIGNAPNGVAIMTKDYIFPHFIGSDIGCGMTLLEMPNVAKKIKVDKFIKKLDKLNSLEDIDQENLGYNLGTIGKGNHFLELLKVEEIKSPMFNKLGIEKDSLYILIHSGSRALGQIIFNRVCNYEPSIGISANSKEALEYLKQAKEATNLAYKSRLLIAKRFLKAIGLNSEFKVVSNSAHNSIEKIGSYYLHRKGATPTNKGAIIIAGSRGSLSYLVMPKGDCAHSNFSLAHGSGRKWPRSSAKAKLSHKFKKQDLTSTKLGSRVYCKDSNLLYEEAPQAYKNIEIVISDLIEANLIDTVASFRPILTYKE